MNIFNYNIKKLEEKGILFYFFTTPSTNFEWREIWRVLRENYASFLISDLRLFQSFPIFNKNWRPNVSVRGWRSQKCIINIEQRKMIAKYMASHSLANYYHLGTKRQWQNTNTQNPNPKTSTPKPQTQKSVAFQISYIGVLSVVLWPDTNYYPLTWCTNGKSCFR